MSELKPCPFCGSRSEIERRGTIRQSMVIACTRCGARVESGDVYGLTHPDEYRWNRRVLDPYTIERCADLIEFGYDKPVKTPYRKDGARSKNDLRPHDRYIHEDCEQCAAAAIRAGSLSKTGFLKAWRPTMAFEFDRYINGELMAEGVTIERQDNLPDAMREAARIASRGSNGEAPVLVLRALAKGFDQK